jgi:ketosteroid isomerase-like protein
MNRRLLASLMVLSVLSGFHLALAESKSEATKEVLAASDAWRQAMMSNDAAVLERDLHPDLTYVHSNGHIQTKAQVIADKEFIKSFDFTDVTVRVFGNVALLKAHVEEGGAEHMAHLDVLHVWVKGPSGWQLVARQAVATSPLTPYTTK